MAGFSSDELLEAAEAVEPYVAAVEIGLVCPNTTETEQLEELRIFTALAEGLAARVTAKPVFIKLPPHHSDADRERIFRMLDVCLRVGMQGVSLSGTRPVIEPRLGMGKGSLAGRDVFADALRIMREVRADTFSGRLWRSGRRAASSAGLMRCGARSWRQRPSRCTPRSSTVAGASPARSSPSSVRLAHCGSAAVSDRSRRRAPSCPAAPARPA